MLGQWFGFAMVVNFYGRMMLLIVADWLRMEGSVCKMVQELRRRAECIQVLKLSKTMDLSLYNFFKKQRGPCFLSRDSPAQRSGRQNDDTLYNSIVKLCSKRLIR